MQGELQIAAAQRVRTLTLRDLAAVFFRRAKLIKWSFLAVASGGILYCSLFPSYRAEMKVLVRRNRIDPAVTPTPSPSPAFEHDEVSEEQLNSQAELLRDTDILRRVVDETGLAHATWLSWLTRQTPDALTEKAALRLASKIDVQPARKSRLITVSYSSGHPDLSAAVLRSLARAYLAKQAELHRPAGERSFFETQVSEARRALDEAQGNLVSFVQSQGVVSAGLQRDLVLQKLSDAEASEMGLESEIAELQRRDRTLAARLQQLPHRRVVQIKNSDNPELQGKLKSRLLELELQRTQLLTKFQPTYRLVQEIDAQIADTKTAIDAEDSRPLRDETTEADPEFDWAHSEQLKTEVQIAALQQKQQVSKQQLADYREHALLLEKSAVTQHDLEQKVKSAEDRWLLYANKREEARIGDALDQDGLLNVAIAEEPHAPATRTWPLWAASLLWVVGAGGLSTGLAFAAEFLDPSFRTPEEVKSLLGAPVLASLPARTSIAVVRREAQ